LNCFLLDDLCTKCSCCLSNIEYSITCKGITTEQVHCSQYVFYHVVRLTFIFSIKGNTGNKGIRF